MSRWSSWIFWVLGFGLQPTHKTGDKELLQFKLYLASLRASFPKDTRQERQEIYFWL